MSTLGFWNCVFAARSRNVAAQLVPVPVVVGEVGEDVDVLGLLVVRGCDDVDKFVVVGRVVPGSAVAGEDGSMFFSLDVCESLPTKSHSPMAAPSWV